MTTNNRKCTCCGVLKPLTVEFFHRRNDKKSLCFRSVCILCRNKQAKENYQKKNEKKIKERATKIQIEQETNSKVCTYCGKPKLISTEYFAPHEKGRYGLDSKCRECRSLIAKNRTRTDEQKRQNAKRAKEYRNSKEGKAYYKEYYNRPHTKELSKKMYEKRKASGKIKEYDRKLYHSNPLFRIKKTLSVGLNTQLKTIATTKPSSTMEYIGCTGPELLKHLNAGEYIMEDYMSGGYDIDHIIPSAYYLKYIKVDAENNVINTDVLYKWWNYRNLRVYPSILNKSKGDILDEEVIKEYGIEDLLIKTLDNSSTL